jgi:hypothetical protein
LRSNRRASSQVTGAALLVVGLVIGAALVFASSYAFGGPSAKTVIETSTQPVTVTSTQFVTLTSTQPVTVTSTQPVTVTSAQSITLTSTSVQTQSVTQTITVTNTITQSPTLTSTVSNLITASASLAVPSGVGPGLLVISIQNSASNSITGIQVAYTNMQDSAFALAMCMGQTPTGLNCLGTPGSGLAACGATNAVLGPPVKTVAFCNSTPTPISTATPLPVGSQVSAAENVIGIAGMNLQSGNTYSMSLTVDFANGGTQTVALSVTAQI